MSTRAFIKPIVGKIQGWIRIHRSFDVMRAMGWYVFDAALLKFVEIPKEGERVLPKHWRGIWIRFSFWIPFDRV